jgi:nucleotide-binding universal stress UspA family protein
MSFSALMVHFDGEPSSYARLRLAVDLARRFEAALIGIAGRLYLPPFLANENAALQEKDEQEEMTRALAEIGRRFSSVVKQVAHAEWRGMPDDVAHLVTNEARAADLIIIGHKQVAQSSYYALDPGAAIVRMGRPVLLVPQGVESLEARRVMVAWKDAHEARRAIRDAIPFLRRAEQVMIVEVCEHGDEAQSQLHMKDLKEYLFRHDVVVAEQAYLHTQQPVASELLRFAKDEGADLLVAGAYGLSRLGEWIFGGVTRGLLGNSPICSLFSH